MRTKVSVIAAFVLYISTFYGCQNHQLRAKADAQEIVVLCPKIFESVINEIKPSFEKANPPYRITVDSYIGSRMLQDILAGKEGDIFLSFGDVELSRLSEKDLLRRQTTKAFAETSLVALAPPDNPLGIKAFRDFGNPKVKKIAIPDPYLNSGGAAVVEAAKKIGIYESIKNRLYLAPSPNAATKYMEQGKADVSITHNRCYYGHAKRNTLVEFLPTPLHNPIVCKAVILKSSKEVQIAEKFIELLLTPQNQERFEKAHFKRVK